MASSTLSAMFFLSVFVFMAATTTANKVVSRHSNSTSSNVGYYYGGFPPKRSYHGNCTHNQITKKIIVGGAQNNWTFGFDYTMWAIKNGTFYVNDTLVFKYDSPSVTNIHPHSVYLFDSIHSFRSCDLTKATMIANTTDGTGDGFEFTLKQWKPYYFACGGGDGFHCNNGKMKFWALPMLTHY